MDETPMTPEQILAMSAHITAQHVTGVTMSGPTTKRHRGAGAALKNPPQMPLDADMVEFALRWALGSGSAALANTDAAQDDPLAVRVPLVMPSGEVARLDAREANSAALLGAEVTCAAEVAVLMNILRRRIARLAALERLRSVAEQVDGLDQGSGA